MKLQKAILFFTSLILLTGCNREKTETRQWFKGNLHTHSYWSDGDEYPEMIMDWYKTNGYSFVALSDHNILADEEKWVKVVKSRMYEEGFEKYLKKFGEEWVTYKVDSGRTLVKLKMYNEYKPRFEDKNFLIIQSEEISDRYDNKPIHMNATNIQKRIEPQGGNSVTDVMQRNIDAVLNQRKETGVMMFPHINHPNFFYAVSVQDLIDLRGERFFEVYNGHPMVNNYGDSLHPGTEQMWDEINIAYSKKNQPLLLGLATDDSHNYHQFGGEFSNSGRGWVMVLADSLNPTSLISAMEEGAFYASSGVSLEEITVEANTINVKVKPEANVTYAIEFIGVRKGEEESRTIKSESGTNASIDLTADYLFVRVRITSSKIKVNPFKEGEYEMAWTQPVVFKP